ncbi:Aldehyde dehydrogenase family 3 member F1 [Cardamine amara subsp. amara]|uniref:Aldehyde dehydrogenase n=1 Tax=Cardamine amara subsp. amara TaxID=228776 RepID=A0ABD0ZBG1_CARAN
MEDMKEKVEQELGEMRLTFKSRKTKSVKWRKTQLSAIIKMIKEKEDEICKALFQDLGKHYTEAYRDELGIVQRSATTALNGLDQWVLPKKTKLPLLFFPAKGEVISEPLGTVLIFASWNFPISVSLDPLIGAISAGNTVMLKPSELSPNSSSFLAKTLPSYLDPKAIKVIEGGPDVATLLLQHKWDKIFFTGSQRVGRIVMSAAAQHLTPVTLELGGKCPTILDDRSISKDIKTAVKRISGAKWGSCSGQVCISVDYLLVEERFTSSLIDMLKQTIKSFYGENPKDSECVSKIVNKKHFLRLSGYLDDPRVKASIVHGGSTDEEKLYIEPTILLDPPLDSDIMTEEIFGPILPIITLRDIQGSVEFVNSRPKPLAIYAFTKDDKLKTRILSETSSGSVTFNDVFIQYVCDALPFGGVGESGIGRYHGKYSFECFSHEKAVMEGSLVPEFEARYPPWNAFKLSFIRLAIVEDYFSLVLLMLGLKK